MSGSEFHETAVGQSTDVEPGDAMGRISLQLLAAYLVVTSPALFRWSVVTGSWVPMVLHASALVVVVAFAQSRHVGRAWREWTPLALLPALYFELRWIIAGAGQPHADALVAAWDRRLFGFDPSSALALQWHSRALSELLHLCYVSYYAIVYVPPALLWLRSRYRDFAATVLALVIVYVLSFLSSVLLPVDGPRFLRGPSAAPEGPIRSLVVGLLDLGSSRGTAFPSAHVAASVAVAMCAFRIRRSVGLIVAVLTVGLATGAVYGGYHYGVDVMAGVITGLVAVSIARVIERFIAERSAAPR